MTNFPSYRNVMTRDEVQTVEEVIEQYDLTPEQQSGVVQTVNDRLRNYHSKVDPQRIYAYNTAHNVCSELVRGDFGDYTRTQKMMVLK